MALTVLLAASSYLHPLNMDGAPHRSTRPVLLILHPTPRGMELSTNMLATVGALAQLFLWSTKCLDISSEDTPQAPRTEISNIQHCFVSKDISKVLVPSLDTSELLCLYPLHLYQICQEGLSILPLRFSQLPTPLLPRAPASFSSTGPSPAPSQFKPSSTSTLHLLPPF